MPAGFRRYLVGKTLINVFHCDFAEIRFACKLVAIQKFYINQLKECYLNNTANRRFLTATATFGKHNVGQDRGNRRSNEVTYDFSSRYFHYYIQLYFTIVHGMTK